MFWHRFGSMIVLLGLLALSMWKSQYGKYSFLIIGTFIVVFLTKELGEMLKNIDITIRTKTVMWVNFLLFFPFAYHQIFYMRDTDLEKYIATFYCCFIPLIILYFSIMTVKSVNSPEKLKNAIGSFFTVFFVTLPVSMITLIFSYGLGRDFNIIFLYFVMVTKSGDIGAYIVGSLSNKILPGGNHKLIPSVSPGKSVEGIVGGVLFSIGVSYLINHFFQIFHKNSISFVIAFGIILYFTGMYGDLVESAIKRTCKVKDSGKTIPGIGGIYDLVDSLFLSAPFMLALLLLSKSYLWMIY